MYDIYIVKEGDTIESIAKKVNVDPRILYQINGFLPDYVLTVGSSIIIPKTMGNTYFDYYTVKQGDSLYKIAQDFNVDYKLLAQVNGVNVSDFIYPNQTIMVPKQGVKIYITKEGDTLAEVASTMGTNGMTLLQQNAKLYLLPEQLIVYKEK